MPTAATGLRTHFDALFKRQAYDLLTSGLRPKRTRFEQDWRRMGDRIWPDRAEFVLSDTNDGRRRDSQIINNTAALAARTGQSGMHSGLTSPARPWMRLSTPDPDLAKFGPVKIWLDEVTERMLTVFEKANLYTSLPEVYGDLLVFGTAALEVIDDEQDVFRTCAYPIGSYWLGLGANRRVASFFREYRMTVYQVIKTFGSQTGQPLQPGQAIDRSRFSQAVLNAWDKSDYQTDVDVCWVVTPNEYADAKKLGSQYLPFASCHYETTGEDRTLLRESGFNEFPIMAPRWATRGEGVYGVGQPGRLAIGDTSQLQVMEKRKGQAIEKQINPPTVASQDMRTQRPSLIAGGVQYTTNFRDGGIRSVHDVTLNLADLNASQEATEYRIRQAFYADLFLQLDQLDAQPMTATEVQERHDEKLQALGPVLERTSDELLTPLVDRVFPMMLRAGLIPPPPQELEGVNLKVEYTSIVAQAQKLIGLNSLDRFMQSVVAYAGAFPEMLIKVKGDGVVDQYGDRLGIPAAILRSDEEVAQIQQAQQAQQQQLIDAEVADKRAKATKNLATAPAGGDTVLSRMAEAGA